MIIELSYSGSRPQKIELIKAVRDVSGLDLKGAKYLVDDVVSGMPQQIRVKDDSVIQEYTARLTAVGFDCNVLVGPALYNALKEAAKIALLTDRLRIASSLIGLMRKADPQSE